MDLDNNLVALGERFRALPVEVVRRAAAENPWFTKHDIAAAAANIADRMLDRTLLKEWLGRYQRAETPKKVGIVMAGNIPLVGFFDLLCVLAAGHECLYKPSSKDAVLMDWVGNFLGLKKWQGEEVEALIATGSGNAGRWWRDKYRGVPMILRGSRSSAAVLGGDESDEELRRLAEDIFAYSGLGCRNVSRLFVPEGYDIGRLAEIFNERECPSEGYKNNFVQRRTILRMQGAKFVEGDYFLLTRGEGFPEYISEIVYSFDNPDSWMEANKTALQCVVGRDVRFGEAHRPGLSDYADGVDTMDFLCKL